MLLSFGCVQPRFVYAERDLPRNFNPFQIISIYGDYFRYVFQFYLNIQKMTGYILAIR